MNSSTAIDRLVDKIRVRHLAYSTEQCYVGWVRRYMGFLSRAQPQGSSVQKFEAYLTHLARVQDVSAVTQNQAFNAIRFFYQEVLGVDLGEVSALRAKRRVHERTCPSRAEVAAIRSRLVDTPATPVRLIFDLLYGCGLRVNEPLDLRLRDILWEEGHLVIRAAKGAKDRRVRIPQACLPALKFQAERAAQVWQWDRRNHPLVGVPLPHQLARKYPRAPFARGWFWLFPATGHCDHPRTGERVRYRVLAESVQRAVKQAAVQVGAEGIVTPHCLRHAYATHLLQSGTDVRTVQELMGHVSLETTAGYCHATLDRAPSPLDALLPGALGYFNPQPQPSTLAMTG